MIKKIDLVEIKTIVEGGSEAFWTQFSTEIKEGNIGKIYIFQGSFNTQTLYMPTDDIIHFRDFLNEVIEVLAEEVGGKEN